MKYFIFSILLAFSALVANAQSYQVYSVKGDVKTSKGAVKKGDKITGTPSLQLQQKAGWSYFPRQIKDSIL